MITKKFVVRNLIADYPFSGDSAKEWFCEVIESNQPNPVINYIRNGSINLTFEARCLNTEVNLAFHTSDEKVAVAEYESIKNITSSLSPVALTILGKVGVVSKKLGVALLVLFLLSFSFAVVNYYFDISGFLETYQKFNAANGAKVVQEKTEEFVKILNDDFYDLPGIKAIEEDQGVDFKEMFVNVDSENGIYLMEDVFNVDGEPELMSQDDLDDKCELLGGEVPALVELEFYIPDKINIASINRWDNYIEWTRNAIGRLSDDYYIFRKGGDVPEGGYIKDGLLVGDDDDVLASGRCLVLKQDFVD